MAAADRSVGPAAIVAALALHLGLFAAFTLTVKPKIMPMGDAVPITIVADAPPTAPAKALAAPVAQAAQTEAPTPDAPPPKVAPEPPPPKPSPAPTLTRPVVAPVPKPPPVAKPVAAVKPVKAKTAPNSTLDLDALQASLAKSAYPAAPKPTFAERGPSRPQSALQSADAPGVSRSDQAGLSQLLNRLWNPNCSVEGGDAVLVSVTFAVGYDGRLTGRVSAGGREASPDPVVATAARRAIDAVHEAEPYQATYRGAQFRINFDARKACVNR